MSEQRIVISCFDKTGNMVKPASQQQDASAHD
ncbi:hypothetical protein F1_00047 [Ralstonia phage Heva]|uniref:Uncharacterized protein n=3 Tax=Cimandefvirus TaxID=2843366 RepID=A0A7G5BAT7_9CAUD|nr:hypothetical protein KMC44_gp42 [Ralstonia phage Cimandef]YP_010078344.1 hypothetical protein KMC46_gp15 [Ralstonia phage Gamede]YP_010078517.1 hypothetical protein KMC48_gp43 [Ralstonia phage Heva]QMV32847.1 hypothetical protein D1_00021 [Ralstonia phage Dimitile]QMV32673.1 hypothetical protein B2_00039 [Ralstonia phage Cimandef]QMV33134.1 hypothetical protein 9Ga_00015 [Ralstonia phage Gamede]QMV33410.1 hypothetical protein F1_00047 [Ralstonia phage Heva]